MIQFENIKFITIVFGNKLVLNHKTQNPQKLSSNSQGPIIVKNVMNYYELNSLGMLFDYSNLIKELNQGSITLQLSWKGKVSR